MNNETTASTPDAPDFEGRATYCPEDNKLRLYIGRVPRDEFLKLRAEGWTTLHKQREAGGCDFVAHWTPERRDTAIGYAGIIEDEDMGPEERAADRAERFAGYREKRTGEATGHADRFDSGPVVHGYQSQARAERSAARHDRIADRAGDAWSKAEYWQRRTAGVISHALHVAAPSVRMGRIKELESAIRKIEKSRSDYFDKYARWVVCSEMTDTEAQTKRAIVLAYVEHGDYLHPRSGRKSYLYDHARREEGRTDDPLTGAELCALWLNNNGKPAVEEGDWLTHYRLRLSYENQMLEAQGGRAGVVEMVPGGWLRGGRHLSNEERQIVKVNKSPATGRVVSVLVRDNHASSHNHWGNPFPDGVAKVLSHTVEVERASPGCYRAPTADELAAFEVDKKARKAAAPKADPCPLINPTDAEAERLQSLWNERAKERHCRIHLKSYGKDYADEFKPASVRRITQATYSANSKGAYARAETREVCRDAELKDRFSGMYSSEREAREKRIGAPVCSVRLTTDNNASTYAPKSVIILTDKPQKPLPAVVWEQVATPAAELVTA